MIFFGIFTYPFQIEDPILVYYYLSSQLLPLARMGLLLVGAKGEEQLLDK